MKRSKKDENWGVTRTKTTGGLVGVGPCSAALFWVVPDFCLAHSFNPTHHTHARQKKKETRPVMSHYSLSFSFIFSPPSYLSHFYHTHTHTTHIRCHLSNKKLHCQPSLLLSKGSVSFSSALALATATWSLLAVSIWLDTFGKCQE